MQTFRLYNPNLDTSIPTADNLNMYSDEYIISTIEKQLSNASWCLSLQYEAIGSHGDIVIYQDGKIQILKSSL